MDEKDGMDFGMPDFTMPDFSQIGKTMNMLSWLPAIISSFSTFLMVFFGQIVYAGLTDGGHYILKSDLMVWFLTAFVSAVIVGVAVKITTSRKMKAGMMFG